MKKVIPKKKNAFLFEMYGVKEPEMGHFQSSFFSVGVFMGVAGKNIYAGNLLMLDKNGMVVPFIGPEGRSKCLT